ncbi:hypothetical protein FW781_16230 [Chryseobacterium panacisoli]|uniref:Uncharacterized protein n=1 Tax=Chryseobacterium panacisoli TaxID=1807141 RepID=A0A5D8ZJF4_9FLAO|nr:hypothetical protein [Chryseobacterium panacisoli]TZF94172.1 hypothetical protein FW781_16230 [Chryseobacterium panacisoli]
MGDFKHLKKEGPGYQVKQYMALQHIIGIAWVCIAILLITNTSYLKTGIILLIFSLLLSIVSFIPPKINFDPENQLLIVTNRGLNRKEIIYRLEDFEGFELQTFRLAFIPLGCYLYADFKNISRFKRPVISQSFSKRILQEITNELEDISGHSTIQ